MLSPRNSLRWMKPPALILVTSFPGTGGREGERSNAGACDAAAGMVGSGAANSEADRLLLADGTVMGQDGDPVSGGSVVTAAISESGGSVPSESMRNKEK